MAKSIESFINELKNNEGKVVYIEIAHQLYGDQKLKTKFHILDDNERLGCLVQNNPIYIYKNKICKYVIEDNTYSFSDDIMCLKIKV